LQNDPVTAGFLRQKEERLTAALSGHTGIHVVTSRELAAKYPVPDYFDVCGEESGHIPYTPLFFAALATMVARRIYALRRSSHKVIVLDCDNTLWKGVCGEDGALGIEIDAGRYALQEFVVRQQEAGMLLCLCSKNQEADVFEVFDRHPDMPLKRQHLVAWRINWQSKSENLKALAGELNLGLDSFIFVDDNAVECAEVAANSPDVLALQLPAEEKDIPRFLDHVWAFDHLKVTEEDRRRTALYQQNLQRERFEREATTLEGFLAGLNLQIEIVPASENQIARISQLTERTNQFNFTTIRRSENEIRQLWQDGRHKILTVSVRDRFGDYGLVGVMIFELPPGALKVDTFLLSCRVLGKGVEHRMLAQLGQLAVGHGRDFVDVPFAPTAKNAPAIDFLEIIGGNYGTASETGRRFRFPAAYASALEYRPTREPDIKRPRPSKSSTPVATDKDRLFGLIGWIAEQMNTPEVILRTVACTGQRSRPDLATAYVAPRERLEEVLAELWCRALSLDAVGIHDNFFELGGTSIQGVFVINRLQERLGEIIHVAVLFDAPSVAELAAYLSHQYPAAVARLSGASAGSQNSPTVHAPGEDSVQASDIALIRKIIKPLAPRRLAAPVPKNPAACFILSAPRSGSTLLRVMLAGHPELFAPPELELLSFNTLNERRAEFSGRHSFWLEGTIRAIMQIRCCDSEEARRIMQSCEDKGMGTLELYGLMQQWIGGKMLVDKTPSYALDLEILRRAESGFENARYVHLVRHPCGMIRSFEEAKLDQIFFRYEHNFGRRKLAELVWQVCNQNILAFLKNIPPERKCRISFENLVAQPESVIKQLCNFLHLSFHPDMLEPYKDKSSRMTDGIHKESKMLGDVKFHQHNRISAQVAGRWKEILAEELLCEASRDLMRDLGYEQTSAQSRTRQELGGAAGTIAPDDTTDLLKRIHLMSPAEVDAALALELAEKRSEHACQSRPNR
jgi:FkbH-like protein